MVINFPHLIGEIHGAKLIRTKKPKPDFCHILTLKKLLEALCVEKIT